MSEEEAIEHLKEYIKEDDIYSEWKNNNKIKLSDFDMYCINHCQAIETILTKLEETKANEYECNNIISDLLDEIKKKDKIIDLMAKEIANSILNTCPYEDYNKDINCENRCSDDDNLVTECWKIYFKEKVENGN